MIKKVVMKTNGRNKVIETSTSNEETFYLSNFYPSEIIFKGLEFPTVEHCYQWCKFRYGTEDDMNDEELDRNVHAELIRKAPTTKKAHDLGHESDCQINPNWQEIKLDLMYELLEIKFKTYPKLLVKLLETKNKIIIEKSYSQFWGSGRDRNGQNMFGKLLMKLRDTQYTAPNDLPAQNKDNLTNGPSAANPLSQDK